MAKEVVRNKRLFLHRGPRRQHAQIAVNLHRIRIDHFAAELMGKRHRQRGLAAGSRAHDHKNARHFRHEQ